MGLTKYGLDVAIPILVVSLLIIIGAFFISNLPLKIIFLALGAIFSLTPTPPRLKAALLVEPWIAIPVTMGSMFGTRYVSPLFGDLMFVASLVTAATFAAMVLASLAALWLDWGRG